MVNYWDYFHYDAIIGKDNDFSSIIGNMSKQLTINRYDQVKDFSNENSHYNNSFIHLMSVYSVLTVFNIQKLIKIFSQT